MKYRNYKNPYTKNSKIYSTSDIYNMRAVDALKRKKELLAQNRTIGIPTDAELSNSENVVWVNEYSRNDGTRVQGHWRAKPGYGQKDVNNSVNKISTILEENDTFGKGKNIEDGVPESSEENNIDFENPEQAVLSVILEVLGFLLKDTEAGGILSLFTPFIEYIVGKIFGDEDEEEQDYSEESDEQVPWENVQNNRPEERETSETEQKNPSQEGTQTGGATNISKKIGVVDVKDNYKTNIPQIYFIKIIVLCIFLTQILSAIR